MEDNNLNVDQGSKNSIKPKKGWWEYIHTDPIPTVSILIAVICTLIALIFGVAIFQIFSTDNALEMKKREIKLELDKLSLEIENVRSRQKKEMENLRINLEEFIKEQKKIFLNKTAMLTYVKYADTIKKYTEKLKGDNVGQQIAAIWILLDILNEVKLEHKEIFNRVVPDYSDSIPWLKLDVSKDEFHDSYRGKVWMWIILLESKDEYIRDVFRTEIKKKPALTPELLDKVFEYNESKLSQESRSDLKISIERLKPLIRSLRTDVGSNGNFTQ
jgi:hypothetical protein